MHDPAQDQEQQADAALQALQDALIAAQLLALDAAQLGGLVIQAHAGPVRQRYLEFLQSRLAPGTKVRKLPLGIQDERLLGGLDLAATLQHGRPVLSKGLLAEIHGGVLMIPMAERLSGALSARIAAVLDQKCVQVQRDGMSAEIQTEFGLVLLDESVADDERVAPELMDRLAFQVNLRDVSIAELDNAIALFELAIDGQGLGGDGTSTSAAASAPSARTIRLTANDLQEISDNVTQALCATAMALGIDSIRASILARRTAEVAGRWLGHAHTEKEDAALAARLVLSPRATVLPLDPAQAPEPPPPENQHDDAHNDDPDEQQDPLTEQDLENLDDVILQAAKAAIPAGLLAQLLSDQRLFARSTGSGKSGAQKKGGRRGRPLGSRPGLPKGHARLSLIDTLRSAVPWQKLRGAGSKAQRLQIRAEDFRIKRFKEKTETTTIFVVDASGSSAIHRLAEAKGAVELLLADCYVRRDQVAVIAFRGQQAEMILPPTRSLVRAKRGLSGLPGGGGTPLALAIEASTQLALSIARKGETPLVVLLTDGKANVSRDGRPGREQAQSDATRAAQQLAAAGIACMVIDTSPQPSEAAKNIAATLHARYMPLPHAGAVQVSQAIQRMSPAR